MFLFSSGPTVQPDATWFAAGLTSTFPETQDHATNLAQHRRCEALAAFKPGCKVFHVPREDPSLATEVDMTDTDFEAAEASSELKDQVLVFQYRGKFHAVDHVRASPTCFRFILLTWFFFFADMSPFVLSSLAGHAL